MVDTDDSQPQGDVGQPPHMTAPPRIGMPDHGAERTQVATRRTKAEARDYARELSEQERARLQPGEDPRYTYSVAKAETDDDGNVVHGAGLKNSVDQDHGWGIVRVLANANVGGPNIGTPADGDWPMDDDDEDDD